MHHIISWPNPSLHSRHTKCILTCVDQTLPCQRELKIYLDLCWPKLSYVSEDTKFISTGVPARTQNVSQHVLKKHNICLRGQKMHLNMYWPNHSHQSDNTIFISKFFIISDDTKCNNVCWPDPSNAARSENPYKHGKTKPLPCQQWHKMCLNLR